MPTFPLVGTFFYPWYGNSANQWAHWKEMSHTPPATWASNYLPDQDPVSSDLDKKLYDSNDKSTVTWQLGEMKRGGIQFAISSWWGQGSYPDKAFRNILLGVMKQPANPYPNLLWTIYYEKEGFSDTPETEIISDLNYIISNYGNDQNFLKIDGKYVIFVYSGRATDTVAYGQKWGRVRRTLGNVYIVLKVFPNWRNYASLVDGWHQYAPAYSFASFAPYSAFISPGFWRYHEVPRLKRDPAVFDGVTRQLKASRANFLLVQTWNEYHEGTMVEPARPIIHDDAKPPFQVGGLSYGTIFLDILAKYFC